MAWAPDYTEIEALREFVRIEDMADDTQLARVITAASRAIDADCNRQFGKVESAEERFYETWWDAERGRWVATIDDLQDVTNLEVKIGQGGDTTTSFQLEPLNAPQKGRPYTRLAFTQGASYRGFVAAATGLWGWSTVPVAVQQACLLQASRFLSRRDAPFGVAGSPEIGSEVRLLSRLDPDVAVSLNGYRRPRRAG